MEFKNQNDFITEASDKLMQNRLEILDDFCKAFFASESMVSGKDLQGILKDFVLNQSTVFENGVMVNKHWFSLKEKTLESKILE